MRLSLLLALALFVAVPASAQDWQFDTVFPPDTLDTDGNGMHGVAVDPDGKIWMQPFGATDSVQVPELANEFQPVRVIYVFNNDGTEAEFSPIKFVDYADGTTERDTLGGFLNSEGEWEGRSGRGLRADGEGNILVSQFQTIFKLDYTTGEGLASVTDDEYCAQGQVGVDEANRVYTVPVCPGQAIKIYNADLVEQGTVSDAASNFSRGITVAPDGLTVYETDFENTYTIIHERPNLFTAFDSVGVAFRGMRVESGAIHPKTGNLWVSSGNPLNGVNNDPEQSRFWRSNTWYEFNRADLETPLDSIVWAGCETFSEPSDDDDGGVCLDTPGRPRGLAFSPTGESAYVVAFSAGPESPGSNAERFIDTSVDIEQNGDATPERYALSQNYPNPFAGTTRIDFELEKAGHVQLRVYDVRGREVARLIDEPLAARSYTADVDASGFAPGTYLYVLEVDGQRVSSNRMTVIR